MRIFCPYTDVQNATLTALSKYFWTELIFVDVHGDWSYLNYFKQRWLEGETFINIEHDVVPWLGAIEEIWNCPHDWCCFTYYCMPGEPHPPPTPIGLVKFSEAFIKQIPDVWKIHKDTYYEWAHKLDPDGVTCTWNFLDYFVYEYAKDRGISPHEHWPSVVNAKPMHGSVTETLGARFLKGGDPLMAPRILNYDLDNFDFVSPITDILGQKNLQELDGVDFPPALTDDHHHLHQSTMLHRRFYDAFTDKIGEQYRRFAKTMAQQIFGTTDVYYQAVPTLRVQFPGDLAVGSMHRDREYGHQDGAVTCWVPLTSAHDSSALWIEGSRDAQNYRAWDCKPGQALIFDSVNWSHGNMRNSTGESRVSFDFRMIRTSDYRDEDQVSVSAGRKLRLGDYYVQF